MLKLWSSFSWSFFSDKDMDKCGLSKFREEKEQRFILCILVLRLDFNSLFLTGLPKVMYEKSYWKIWFIVLGKVSWCPDNQPLAIINFAELYPAGEGHPWQHPSLPIVPLSLVFFFLVSMLFRTLHLLLTRVSKV